MGYRNPIGEESMSMQEFDNETKGNDCRWRVVSNEYCRTNGKPAIFIYRRVNLFGETRTEYLNTRGKIDHNCGDGHFADMAAVGVAFIMLQANSGTDRAYEPSYLIWLEAKRREAAEIGRRKLDDAAAELYARDLAVN